MLLWWKHRELENNDCVNDIYRDLILERAHFIVTLCQKCSFIRGQEAKETGNQYLGLWYLNWERKSLSCYFYCGMMLEILYFVSIIIQYFEGCRFKKPSQGQPCEIRTQRQTSMHTYFMVGIWRKTDWEKENLTFCKRYNKKKDIIIQFPESMYLTAMFNFWVFRIISKGFFVSNFWAKHTDFQ